MQAETIGVDNLGFAAYCSEIKTVLALFDKVLHLAATAIKPDHLMGF